MLKAYLDTPSHSQGQDSKRVSGAALTDSTHSCLCKACCPALNATQLYIYRRDLAFWPIWNLPGQWQVERVCALQSSTTLLQPVTPRIPHCTCPNVCCPCDWMMCSILLTMFPQEIIVGEIFLKSDKLRLCSGHHTGIDLSVWPLTSWLINHLSERQEPGSRSLGYLICVWLDASLWHFSLHLFGRYKEVNSKANIERLEHHKTVAYCILFII